MGVVLTVVEGPRKGLRFHAGSKTAITIGRSKTTDFHILDSGMSRVHAAVARGADGWFVEDQKSRNGVWIRDQRVDRAGLETGELFRLGKTTVVRFELASADVLEPGEVPVSPPCAACGDRIKDDDKLVRGARGRPYHVHCRNLDHLEGSELGEFRVLEPMEPLGDAFFFRARQPTLNRTVVLEVFDPPLTSRPGFRGALLQEVRRASRFVHPNILQILDFGEARGMCFVVMEHFPGEPLSRVLERQRFVKVRGAVKLSVFALEALAYAVDQGSQVSWLSPKAVLISTAHDVKLKLMAEPRSRAESGPTPMEAAYVAPEVIAGGGLGEETSAVYSVSALLYHMLAGISPFEGETVKEVAARMHRGRPPSLRRINLKVSPALAKTVEAGIARDPTDRPQTLADLHDQLQSALGPATR